MHWENSSAGIQYTILGAQMDLNTCIYKFHIPKGWVAHVLGVTRLAQESTHYS